MFYVERVIKEIDIKFPNHLGIYFARMLHQSIQEHKNDSTVQNSSFPIVLRILPLMQKWYKRSRII